MKRLMSSRQRIWLLLTNAVLSAVFALLLIPEDWIETAIRYWSMPVLAILLALFLWVLIKQLKRLPRQAFKKRFSKGIIVILVTGSAFQLVHEDFGYKILMDEYNLTATSMNMHMEKSAFTPTRGRIVEGEFDIVDGYVDKRPFLYPFLLSLVHDISGYRMSNPFVLNTVLTGCLMLVVYLAGFHIGNKRGGILAVILLAGWPLLGQNATGAGFELLNFLLLSLTVFLTLSLTSRPGLDKETLLVLSAILLANVRYESFMFLVPVVLVVCLRWKSNNRLGPGWVTTFAPWLLVPLFFQNRMFRKREGLWELPEGVAEAFSFSYIPENIGHAAAYFLNWSADFPNSLLLTIAGSITLFFLLVASVKRIKNWIKFRPKDYDVLGLWGAVLIGHLCVILSYHAGALDSHFATRLGMPIHLILILAPVWLLVKEKMAQRFWTLSVTASLLFLITISAPHSSKAIFTKKNFAEREFRWAREYLLQQEDTDFLIIDSKVSHWASMQLQAMHFNFAKVNKGLIQEYLDNGNYRNVFVIQRISFDPANETIETLGLDQLPDFKLQMLDEFSSKPFQGIRLSRLIPTASR